MTYAIEKNIKEKLVKTFSYLGLVYAVTGWLNDVFLNWTDSVLLSHYSEFTESPLRRIRILKKELRY